MDVKRNANRCLWLALVLLMSGVLILEGKAVVDTILAHPDLTVRDYDHLDWALQKTTVFYLPIWCLALLRLLRSFLGENWFPFAERIPMSVTKAVVVVAAALWIGLAVFSAVYLKQIQKSYDLYYRMESVFSRWGTVFPVILYYAALLYIEQWCIQRKCTRQSIRKKQLWFTVTLFLTFMVLFCLGGVKLWYIPLSHVDSPNTLEDFDLWLFSLYFGVLFLPPWFLSARKTIRLFGHEGWLSLSAVIPRKVTVLTTLALTGFIAWQIGECRNWSKLLLTSDLPEYGQAAANLHLFYAMVGGLAFLCTICILIKQLRATYKEKQQHSEESVHPNGDKT